MDVDDSGSLDTTDGVYPLLYAFLGGPPPPPPFPLCGADPTGDDLQCKAFGPCGPRPAPPAHFLNSIGMDLVYLPPGSFLMGSPLDERGRNADETLHRVNLTCGFYLGATEVTQRQYQEVMGVNPSYCYGFHDNTEYGVDLDRPVERVGWLDAVRFCQRLSEREGNTYGLPTEAQWDYACRAGTRTRFSFGDALECADEHVDCDPCPSAREYMWGCFDTCKTVGQKKPNAWGLYDMHGNMAEFCQDLYGPYPLDEVTDPTGPARTENGERVIRDFGSYSMRAGRSAFRESIPTSNPNAVNVGFRVVLVVACD